MLHWTKWLQPYTDWTEGLIDRSPIYITDGRLSETIFKKLLRDLRPTL